MDKDKHDRIQQAYILAGGKSSRFGSPKGLVDVGGMTLIERLCRTLHSRAIDPTIVIQPFDDHMSYGWPCIRDELEDAGPLHGIQRALKDCRDKSLGFCWILTCDLWEWNPLWEEIVTEVPFDRKKKCFAILLEAHDQFIPFPGVYSVSSLKTIEKAWDQGIRSLRSWQTTIHDRIERVPIIKNAYPQTFNTLEEFAKLRSARGA